MKLFDYPLVQGFKECAVGVNIDYIGASRVMIMIVDLISSLLNITGPVLIG